MYRGYPGSPHGRHSPPPPGSLPPGPPPYGYGPECPPPVYAPPPPPPAPFSPPPRPAAATSCLLRGPASSEMRTSPVLASAPPPPPPPSSGMVNARAANDKVDSIVEILQDF
ncbi:unnamed protein product [Phytophthora lilii]|uniref:Unnamed protein product n=1 Tax=Phytophthora lilii TaxID=2077276 RepID=A0A9W6WH70_9STRA|nr:unnamed protein product [Phytophthora lilii]